MENKQHPALRERNHAGNGRKAEGAAELGRLLSRIQIDLKKVNDHKKVLGGEISILKEKIADAEELGKRGEQRNLELQLSKAEKTLQDLEKTAPSIDKITDPTVLEELIEEYRSAKERKFHAEKQMNESSDPMKAMGEVSRATAEVVELENKVETALNDMQEKIRNAAPELSEGIQYTHEQAVSDDAEWDKKHPGHENREEASTVLSEMGSEITSNSSATEQTMENSTIKTENEPKSEGIKNWQDEAISEYEKEGGKIFLENSEKNSEPVEPTTVADAINAEDSIIETSTEKSAEQKVIEEQAEQIKKLNSKISSLEGKVDAKAEKLGLLDQARKVGEYYKNLPLHTKLLVSGGLIISGAGAAAIGSAAAVGAVGAISVGMRGVSGLATFSAMELWLKNRAEKKGVERNDTEMFRDTAIAASISILLAGIAPALASQYLSTSDILSGKEDAITKLSEESKAEAMGQANLARGAELAAETAAPTNFVEVAVEGDTLWGLAKKQLGGYYGEKFSALSIEDQNRAISSVVNSYENPDQLAIGEEVDFSDALKGKDLESLVSESSFIKPSAEYITETSIPDTGIVDVKAEPTSFSSYPQYARDFSNGLVTREVDILFNDKGFFGFGGTAGSQSLHWMNPEAGFASRTVEEVMKATPEQYPTDNTIKIGIENYKATDTMKTYLETMLKSTGLEALKGESVKDYLLRSYAHETYLKGQALMNNK